MRFAIQKRNKAKSERGRAQQKQPQPRFSKEWHSQKDALNESVAAQKVKHFRIVVADRQQGKVLAVHHCIPASQSPLTSSCSGVWFKTKSACREPNSGF